MLSFQSSYLNHNHFQIVRDEEHHSIHQAIAHPIPPPIDDIVRL